MKFTVKYTMNYVNTVEIEASSQEEAEEMFAEISEAESFVETPLFPESPIDGKSLNVMNENINIKIQDVTFAPARRKSIRRMPR